MRPIQQWTWIGWRRRIGSISLWEGENLKSSDLKIWERHSMAREKFMASIRIPFTTYAILTYWYYGRARMKGLH